MVSDTWTVVTVVLINRERERGAETQTETETERDRQTNRERERETEEDDNDVRLNAFCRGTANAGYDDCNVTEAGSYPVAAQCKV